MKRLDALTRGYIALRPAAAARTLARLESRDIQAIFDAMPRQLAASVLQHMTPGSAARCMAQLPVPLAGEILGRVPMSVAAAMLRAMPRERVKALLAVMPRPAAARVRLRLRYAETVIGAFVDADVVTLAPEHRVADALRFFRHAAQRPGHVIYVLNNDRRLAGEVDLAELLVERDRIMIQHVMRPPRVVLNARAAIQTMSSHPAWLSYESLPVVGRDGVFQGVLHRSRVLEEEQQLLNEVADRNELASTRAALADIFWLGAGALFVGNGAQAAQHRPEE